MTTRKKSGDKLEKNCIGGSEGGYAKRNLWRAVKRGIQWEVYCRGIHVADGGRDENEH